MVPPLLLLLVLTHVVDPLHQTVELGLDGFLVALHQAGEAVLHGLSVQGHGHAAAGRDQLDGVVGAHRIPQLLDLCAGAKCNAVQELLLCYAC